MADDQNGQFETEVIEAESLKPISEPNIYKFKEDSRLDQSDDMIAINTRAFKALFKKGEDDMDYRSAEVTLVVYYQTKFLWFKHDRKLRKPVGIVIRNTNKSYPNATTIGFSHQLKEALDKAPYVVEHERIKLAILKKKPSFWLGLTWSHPKTDINLGFIWTEISLALSVIFYILGLFGEAYHWADGLRHMIDGLFL